jgi:hypothetical protein
MRSSDRPPIRRESCNLRVESLEDRQLLTNSPFVVELPHAIAMVVPDTSIVLVSKGDFSTERASALALVQGASATGNLDLSTFLVAGRTPSLGSEASILSVAHTFLENATPYVGVASVGVAGVGGLTQGEHGAVGWAISPDGIARPGSLPPGLSISGQGIDGILRLADLPGNLAALGPEAIDQFLRSPPPFKAGSMVFVGEPAGTDSASPPNPATPDFGRGEARIIRALRDFESEVAFVVANSDGSDAGRSLPGQSQNRPISLSTEVVVKTGEQPASSPGAPGPAVGEADTWSPADQRWVEVDGAVETTALTPEIELLASFNPFDRANIDRAIDDLLGGLGDLESALPSLQEARDLLPHALGTAAALTVVEIVRRKIRGNSEDSDDVMDSGSPGVPSFPDRWALDER